WFLRQGRSQGLYPGRQYRTDRQPAGQYPRRAPGRGLYPRRQQPAGGSPPDPRHRGQSGEGGGDRAGLGRAQRRDIGAALEARVLKSAIPTVTLSVRDRFADAVSRFRQMGSSLYGILSKDVVADEDILALADEAAPGQPSTHLLFGAVQYLLFEQPDAPLARY